MKTAEMPAIPFTPASDFEAEVLSKILKNGHLRANLDPKKVPGEVYYIWRNVAFYVSPERKHQCLPIACEFYVEGTYEERSEKIKNVLDPLVDRIVDSVPVRSRHGLMAWGRAFGIIR